MGEVVGLSARRDVVRMVMRLIDYGKGGNDPEFDALTTGQIADQILVIATVPRDGDPTGLAAAVEALANTIESEKARTDGVTPWKNGYRAGMAYAARIVRAGTGTGGGTT